MLAFLAHTGVEWASQYPVSPEAVIEYFNVLIVGQGARCAGLVDDFDPCDIPRGVFVEGGLTASLVDCGLCAPAGVR